MPFYRVSREFLAYEEAIIEAASEGQVREMIDENWEEFESDIVDSYNYTGNDSVELM